MVGLVAMRRVKWHDEIARLSMVAAFHPWMMNLHTWGATYGNAL